MAEIAKPKVLHQKFDAKNVRHLAIVTVAAIPLTSILIILFILLYIKLKAVANLPTF